MVEADLQILLKLSLVVIYLLVQSLNFLFIGDSDLSRVLEYLFENPLPDGFIISHFVETIALVLHALLDGDHCLIQLPLNHDDVGIELFPQLIEVTSLQLIDLFDGGIKALGIAVQLPVKTHGGSLLTLARFL